MSSTGYSLAQMTDVDKADVATWLARAQRDLTQTGFGELSVRRETGSVLDLAAALTIGGTARSATLTVYKRYGRVRIAADGDSDAAARLEEVLAGELELVVATRLAGPRSDSATAPAVTSTVQRTLARRIGV